MSIRSRILPENNRKCQLDDYLKKNPGTPVQLRTVFSSMVVAVILTVKLTICFGDDTRHLLRISVSLSLDIINKITGP